MYDIFEKLFYYANLMGVDRFTGYFLLFQILLFLGLLSFPIIKIKQEMKVMKSVGKELATIKRSSDSEAHEIDQRLNDIFSPWEKSKYKFLWDRYYNRVTEKKEDERINVEPFFGFDIMTYHMGYRQIMDMGAGIHVSFGVLGTFIGLSMGLSELQITDTEALRTGVGGLLDGMKVAFYTSVLGVVLSLVSSFVDRLYSGRLEKEIDWHSEKMDYLLSTDEEELFLNRLEKITRNQADHMKTLLTDALEKVMQPVVTSFQQSNGQISNAFLQMNDQFSKLHTGIESQSKLLEDQLKITQNNSTDISNRLVDQITGGTQESIDGFSNLVKDTQLLQTQMVQTVNEVVNQFATSQSSQSTTLEKTEQLIEKFEVLTSEMDTMKSSYSEASAFLNHLSGSFQDIQQLTQDQLPVQQEVMKSNQALAEKYDGLTERFKEFNQNIERKYEDLMDEVLTVSKSLTGSFEQMTNKLSSSMQVQSHMLKESDELLTNIKGVVEYITPIAPELKGVVGNIQSLKDQLFQMQKLQNDLLPELVDMKQQTNETVKDALVKTKDYMNHMTQQIESMTSNWSSTKNDFEQTRSTLSTSVKDFADNIDTGLAKTYQNFDETLTNAVKQVSQLVFQFSDLQKDFVDTLELLTEDINNAKQKQGASHEKS